MNARGFTVGPLQENCWIVDGGERAIVIDPGDEGDRIIEALEPPVEAILLTHTHFDHVGAVAQLARHTGAPVYCPRLEVPILKDINSYVFPGYGPYEPYDPEETLDGGERLSLAGLDIDVIFTPGHSPGHVSFSVPEHKLLFAATCCSRARSAAPTCPAATTRR